MKLQRLSGFFTAEDLGLSFAICKMRSLNHVKSKLLFYESNKTK